MPIFNIGSDNHPDWIEFSIEPTGVVRWTSVNRVPPKDIVEAIERRYPSVSIAACNRVRDLETDEFLKAYKASMLNRTPQQIAEERAEALAAFGPGVEVVNVFTGETYRT